MQKQLNSLFQNLNWAVDIYQHLPAENPDIYLAIILETLNNSKLTTNKLKNFEKNSSLDYKWAKKSKIWSCFSVWL